MAVALPSISTKCGALAEVVDHERTALVAEPEGKELAAAMLRILEDQELRKRLGAAGRREIEQRFSAARMVENTVRVYEVVLRERREA
jgi:MMP alpha-(1->4)-mannosyltransferase